MGVNRGKVPLFGTQSVYGKQDSTNYHQNLFSADFEHTSPLVRRFLVGRRPMNPRSVPLGNGAPGERLRRYAPPPGMVRNSGPHFDQALDQPVHGPFHFFPVGK